MICAGPSGSEIAPSTFEAFLKVPKFLRPHTQIFCTRYALLLVFLHFSRLLIFGENDIDDYTNMHMYSHRKNGHNFFLNIILPLIQFCMPFANA
jgi:hypothetical protein